MEITVHGSVEIDVGVAEGGAAGEIAANPDGGDRRNLAEEIVQLALVHRRVQIADVERRVEETRAGHRRRRSGRHHTPRHHRRRCLHHRWRNRRRRHAAIDRNRVPINVGITYNIPVRTKCPLLSFPLSLSKNKNTKF